MGPSYASAPIPLQCALPAACGLAPDRRGDFSRADARAMTAKRRRRWYQYSLRALLVLVLLVSVVMSSLAVALHRARIQLMAANALSKAGARLKFVERDTKFPRWLRELLGEELFRDLVQVSLAGTHANDKVLEHLEGTPAVKTLYLDGTRATDAGLSHLQGLTDLETLYLDATQVTDAGLEHLEKLTSLETLSLGGTKVTGTGLNHLQPLTSLTTLYLGGTQVNDAALEHVAALKNLKSLYLDGTQVTDAGLGHFSAMANLRTVRLDGTLVTNEGVQKLRAALPGCSVVRWDPSDPLPGPATEPAVAWPAPIPSEMRRVILHDIGKKGFRQPADYSAAQNRE